MSTFSSETMEQETTTAVDETVMFSPKLAAAMSSSYEDLYQGTDITEEKSSQDFDISVGDRFDQPNLLGEKKSSITSSFENLYAADVTSKESIDAEEDNIDETERLRRELGERKDDTHKLSSLVATPEDKSEEYDTFDVQSSTRANEPIASLVDLISPELPRRHSPTNSVETGPIDVTLESGLDRVGCASEGDVERESLSRSYSYDNRGENLLSSSPRQRYYSSPDYASVHSDGSQVSSSQFSRGS